MIKNYLQDLCKIDAVPSYEDDVASYVFNVFKRHHNDVRIDRIGNVILHLGNSNESKPRIVVFAHMDEVGFIVRKIERNGFLRFERLGGVNTQVLPGTVIRFLGNQGIRGVIGVKSHHFMKPEEKFLIPKVEEQYIDIGAKNAEEVRRMGIQVGDVAVFNGDLNIDDNGLIRGKALDDRIGCAILCELSENLDVSNCKSDVYLVACVMEEYNIRGILPAIRQIKPDISIGIDITVACDTPDLNYSDIALGEGPAFTHMSFHGRGTLAGVLPDHELLNQLKMTSSRLGINYQNEVAMGVITENAYILFENDGVSVANISIPTRYTHTAVETICLQDAISAYEVLFNFVCQDHQNVKFGKERR